jgi:hypothetical protein
MRSGVMDDADRRTGCGGPDVVYLQMRSDDT